MQDFLHGRAEETFRPLEDAPDDDALWIQQIDENSQPGPQLFPACTVDGNGGRVSRLRCLGGTFGGDAVQIRKGAAVGGAFSLLELLHGGGPGQLGDASAAGKALEGTGLAVSHRPELLHPKMTDLPGIAAGAGVEPPV